VLDLPVKFVLDYCQSFLNPESVSMKAGRSENAGGQRRLRRFTPASPGELRPAVTPAGNAQPEAFRASGGLNASRIQIYHFAGKTIFCKR
jgi:hypothetical protein